MDNQNFENKPLETAEPEVAEAAPVQPEVAAEPVAEPVAEPAAEAAPSNAEVGAAFATLGKAVTNNPTVVKVKTTITDFIQKTDKKVLIAIGAGAAAFVFVAVLLICIFGNTYKTPLKNYVDVMFYAKAGKVDNLAPKEYWEWYEDKYDKDVKDLKEDLKDEAKDIKDEFKDEYGWNYKVKTKITDKDKLDKDDLKELAETLHDKYDIKKSKIKKAYELEVELTIKGVEDKDETEMTVYSIKIGSKWYLVSKSGSFMLG